MKPLGIKIVKGRLHFKSKDKQNHDSLLLRLQITGKRQLLCGKLKDVRIKKGISQSDLAFDMGVNQNYISRVESGKINISINNLLMMAYYLDCWVKIKAKGKEPLI
jgi:DNA-binding XRE family transcriptional regulator